MECITLFALLLFNSISTDIKSAARTISTVQLIDSLGATRKRLDQALKTNAKLLKHISHQNIVVKVAAEDEPLRLTPGEEFLCGDGRVYKIIDVVRRKRSSAIIHMYPKFPRWYECICCCGPEICRVKQLLAPVWIYYYEF